MRLYVKLIAIHDDYFRFVHAGAHHNIIKRAAGVLLQTRYV